MASLGCFENTDFTWLEFSDNLKSKGSKREDINNIDSLLERGDIYVWESLFHFRGQENKVNQVQFSCFCRTTLSETWFTQFPKFQNVIVEA